jgi:hypothetical protein
MLESCTGGFCCLAQFEIETETLQPPSRAIGVAEEIRSRQFFGIPAEKIATDWDISRGVTGNPDSKSTKQPQGRCRQRLAHFDGMLWSRIDQQDLPAMAGENVRCHRSRRTGAGNHRVPNHGCR